MSMRRRHARLSPAMATKRGAARFDALAAAVISAGLNGADALRASRRRVAVWFCVLPLLLAVSVANAQQVPNFWPTTADVVTALGMDNGEVTLWFHHPDCLFGNCEPGRFYCVPGDPPHFAFHGFTAAEMAAWFLHDNAAYGYDGTKLVVSFDGVIRSYWIWDTVFNDSSTLLDVHGGTEGDFIDLFAAASDIRVITPWREFRLPSTPEAMADRAGFARACAG